VAALIPPWPEKLALVDAERTSLQNQEQFITCPISKYPEHYSQ